jgi:hypothetical protein
LNVPRHGDTSRLDLAVGDPLRLESHEAELAESDRIAA